MRVTPEYNVVCVSDEIEGQDTQDAADSQLAVESETRLRGDKGRSTSGQGH